MCIRDRLKCGKDRAAWALLIAAFLIGIPLFFEVAVVIMAPLAWSLSRETRRSILFYALPMLSALTIIHSLVPPHPAPVSYTHLDVYKRQMITGSTRFGRALRRAKRSSAVRLLHQVSKWRH